MAIVSPDLFIDAVLAYQQTAALKAAIELDLFSKIAEGANTAEQLMKRTGAAVRGIRILCDYLTIRGHLEREGNGYRLTPSTAMFLDRNSPSWIGSIVEFLAAPEMMESFLSDPTSYVRNGGSIDLAHNTPNHPIWVKFARTMAPMRAPVATSTACELARWSPHKVLDVAAGHGMFGIAIARAVPSAHITAVDWQAVLSIARENAKAAGVSDRYHALAGSAFEADWGKGFDLILMANFLHQFDYAACVTLLRKVRESLVSNGRAAVVETLPAEDLVLSATFSFQMLGSTPHGEMYTAREFGDMGLAAGFAKVSMKSMLPSPQSLFIFEGP